MNKKEKRLAMATALQSAAASITVVDDVEARARGLGAPRGAALPGGRSDGGRRAQASLPEPKTKLLAGALQRWGAPEGGSVLLIVDELSERVQLASRNLAKLEVNTVAKLNGYDILRADRIIMERAALRHIQVCRARGPPPGTGPGAQAVPCPPSALARARARGRLCAEPRGARAQEFYGGERGEDEEAPASAPAALAEAAEPAPAEAAEAAPAEAAEAPAEATEAPAEAPGTEPAAGA